MFALFNIFFLCFNGNPPRESKKYDLKCFLNSEFFSIEVIKITSDISSAEMHMSYCHFALNNLSFKRKASLKFYQFLILLSSDISLNPGPDQDLHDIEDKFELFRKRGLHFLHINVNSLLSKIDELRDFVGHTKPAILGITELTLDCSVTNQEVNISGYSILRNDRNRNGAGVACYIRSDLCFNSRNIFSNSIEHIFFDLLISKMKPISIGIFYRTPNANNFLESFINDLRQFDFKKSEAYFLGDFNINILLNDKFALKEN